MHISLLYICKWLVYCLTGSYCCSLNNVDNEEYDDHSICFFYIVVVESINKLFPIPSLDNNVCFFLIKALQGFHRYSPVG